MSKQEIDYNSWQTCQRKLKEANERIVEFERIKAEHLAEIEKAHEFIRDIMLRARPGLTAPPDIDWIGLALECEDFLEGIKLNEKQI